MKETSVFKQLDFMMLPTSEHTSIFENEFMLADNFGMPSSEIKYNDFAITSDPFKIDFTLILFCTQGHMDLRLNLQDFRLQAGSVLVVLPNSIGECIEISDDFQVAMIAFSNEKYADNIDLESSIRFIKYLSTDSLIPFDERANGRIAVHLQCHATQDAPTAVGVYARNIERLYASVVLQRMPVDVGI